MPEQFGAQFVLDRLATAGLGIREQVSTAAFLSAIRGHMFLVRAAISLATEPTALVFVLDDLPSSNLIGRRVSHYGRVAVIEAHIAGEALAHWCEAGSGEVDGTRSSCRSCRNGPHGSANQAVGRMEVVRFSGRC